MIAFLFFSVAAGLSQIPPAEAGPISDMMARYRQNKAMKLPPMEPAHSMKPVKDINVQTASFATRLKKRFSFKKTPTSGVIPFKDKSASNASN
jgi:hypothetical protein